MLLFFVYLHRLRFLLYVKLLGVFSDSRIKMIKNYGKGII